MFSLFGLCSLLFFLYLRPQEAIPSLQAIPALNLCAVLAALGLVIDVRLHRAEVAPAPTLRWVLLLGLWGILATFVKAGSSAAYDGFNRILIPWVVMVLIAHGVTSFRSFQIMVGTLLLLGLTIAGIGVHQAHQPFGCFQLKDAWADRELAGGKYDGRPCETNRECFTGDIEPGADYLCERPGLLGTSSIGHGRVRYRGILQDPNEMALAIGMVVPFAFAFWERRRKVLRALLAGLTVILVGMCTVYTQSRGGQLVFIAVLGSYFVRRFGLVSGAVSGLLIGVPILLLGGRSGAEADSSANERAEALYAGIDMIRSSPVLGVGITQFVEHHFITAHNSYLLALAEMGLPGLFLWSSTLYLSMKILVVALRRYAGRPEAQVAMTWAMALLASYCGLLVGIFFLSFSYHVVLFVYLGLAGAFYNACRRHDPEFEVRYSLLDAGFVMAADVMVTGAIFVMSRLKVD